jgi:hypothetical protein
MSSEVNVYSISSIYFIPVQQGIPYSFSGNWTQWFNTADSNKHNSESDKPSLHHHNLFKIHFNITVPLPWSPK